MDEQMPEIIGGLGAQLYPTPSLHGESERSE